MVWVGRGIKDHLAAIYGPGLEFGTEVERLKESYTWQI